jgi:hypothetical protein
MPGLTPDRFYPPVISDDTLSGYYGANTVCSYFCCELSPLNISKLRAGAGAAVALAGYAGPPLCRI